LQTLPVEVFFFLESSRLIHRYTPLLFYHCHDRGGCSKLSLAKTSKKPIVNEMFTLISERQRKMSKFC